MNTTTKIGIGTMLGIMIASMLILLAILSGKSQMAIGSIGDGQAYQATTTPNVNGGAVSIKGSATQVYGQLGSVIITGPRSGSFQLYDATTSNVNLRTGNPASSTILLAEIPAGAASSTYVFDVEFKNGLLFAGVGNVPTSTITFR